jgi:hypothetical protein
MVVLLFKDIPKIKESVVLEEAIKKGLIDKKDIERLLDESVLTRKLDGGIMTVVLYQ